MSSFYGNGGYSSGGGGGSGEVISVNGKKGQVTLNAADVHALPDSTLIPSLDGFATEAWVNNQDFLISEDISGKADKTEIIPKPVTAGTEGQVLTIDANGNPTKNNNKKTPARNLKEARSYDGKGNIAPVTKNQNTRYGKKITYADAIQKDPTIAQHDPGNEEQYEYFENNGKITVVPSPTQEQQTTGSYAGSPEDDNQI